MPKAHRDGYSAYVERLRELSFVADVRLEPPDVSSSTPRMRKRWGEGEGAATPAPKDRDATQSADYIARLTLKDGGEAAYRMVRPSRVPSNLEDYRVTETELPWLFALPAVGAQLGGRLEDEGLAFIDMQGNCNVRVGDRYLARIQRPLTELPAITKRTAMRAPGYQVLYALLVDWSLITKSQRDIAAAAGTSKQPVADLLHTLVRAGIAIKSGRTHQWATYATGTDERGPNGELLERWVAGYRDSLRSKLIVGRYRLSELVPPSEVEEYLEEQVSSFGADSSERIVLEFSGTRGAYRLAPHYEGPLIVVHLGPANEALRREIRAMPSAEGNLIWLDHMHAPPVADVVRSGDEELPPHTANPLLVFAELMCDADPRAREAAELVREKWLPWSL